MQVGQNAYEADVLTAIKTDQREIFYDVVGVQPVNNKTLSRTHMESEDSGSSLREGSGDTSTSLPKAMRGTLADTREVSSNQSIAQASGESNANEAAVLKTTLKRLVEQVSSALPNSHMRLKNFVQFS